MKKKRQRRQDYDENERLQQENRELKKEIRQLQQQVKKLTRGGNKNKARNVSKSELYEEPEAPTCPECHKGNLVMCSILNRHFERCTICEYRSKTKKI